MKRWAKTLAFMSLALLATAACEDGATDTQAVDLEAVLADAALVAADGMFQDLAHMASPGTWAAGGTAPESAPVEFEGSRSFSRTVTYYDKTNQVQDKYHPTETAEMHIVTDLDRKVEHTFWSAEVKRHRDMTVTGLADEETERTWNGTSSGHVEKSRHPEGEVIREYEMRTSATINGVVRGVPRSEKPWPLGGSITRVIHVEVTKDGQKTERDITATINFNGTQFATMTVDGETWEIDLAEKGVKRRYQKP